MHAIIPQVFLTASRSVRNMAYIAHVVSSAVRWSYARVCTACVEQVRYGFNPSEIAVTVNRQSAKDIDQYFKTKLHVEDSRPPKVGTHFTEWVE